MRKKWLALLFIIATTVSFFSTALASQNEQSTALTFSNPTIVVALLGSIVTVIGWAVANIYSTIHDAYTRRQLARLEHLRKRIEELYGPLVGIIRQTFVVYEIASRVLPTNDDGEIDQNKFQGKDIDAWRFFQERYLFPLNAEAISLLKTKTHLIGHEIPHSFEEFLSHATQFECLYQLWHATGFDSYQLWHSTGLDSSGKVEGRGWPSNFYGDVSSRLGSIRADYAKTLQILNL